MNNPTFDIRRHHAKIARAERRSEKGAGFLHAEAAQIIGERLAVTNRQFEAMALLFDGQFSELIENRLMAENPPIKGPIVKIQKPTDENAILALEPKSLDLIISVFDLHRLNNLPELLLQIHHALKADGLFMAIFPCEGTLKELRTVLLNAEAETASGVSPRVDLFPHIRQLGDLVRKIDFKLPVVDLEERVVRYSNLDNFIKDVRDIRSGNSNNGDIHPLIRSTWDTAKKIYNNDYSDPDGKLRVTIAMGCVSGWKEDRSQQKPLKPGSAKAKLSDFL